MSDEIVELDVLAERLQRLGKAVLLQAVRDATYTDTGDRAKPEEREQAREFLYTWADRKGSRDSAVRVLGQYHYGLSLGSIAAGR